MAALMPPAAINLDLHVRDVVALLDAEDLIDVILVGHAYAGMVITGVAELAPERISTLAYVNGVAPADGEAMVDQLEAVRGPEFVARIRGFIAEGAPFMPAPTTGNEIAQRWGITDPSDQAFMLSRLFPSQLPSQLLPSPSRCGSATPMPQPFAASSSCAANRALRRWLSALRSDLGGLVVG